MESPADAIRRRIRDCGFSASELSRRTGVKQPTITEFLRGKDIRLDTATKLMTYLNFRVTDVLVHGFLASKKSIQRLAKESDLSERTLLMFFIGAEDISEGSREKVEKALEK